MTFEFGSLVYIASKFFDFGFKEPDFAFDVAFGSFQTFGSFRPDRAARTPWSFGSRLCKQGDSRSDPSAQDAYTDDGSYETAAGNFHGAILLQDGL